MSQQTTSMQKGNVFAFSIAFSCFVLGSLVAWFGTNEMLLSKLQYPRIVEYSSIAFAFLFMYGSVWIVFKKIKD